MAEIFGHKACDTSEYIKNGFVEVSFVELMLLVFSGESLDFNSFFEHFVIVFVFIMDFIQH